MPSLRAVAILAVLVLSTSSARAQATLPAQGGEQISRHVFGIGVSAGPVSGIGLSFRHHLPARFSYQVTGGIIKVDEKLSYAVGGEAQFDFTRKESDRFFLVLAAGYYYTGKPDDNELEGPARVGLGVGAELSLGGPLHANGEILFSYFSDGNVLPLPQVGLYYYFY
jgi:hypothetical protein